MRSVNVQWVVGFKQKQWLSRETFQNIINIQTYNWTNYALCESTLTVGIQAEAMASIRNFSKYYTHSNIQMNKLCALWKYSDWWASSRSNGFQTIFFEALYTFKHTIEQSMRSVIVHWVVGFKQKQWFSEEVFQNIIHIQTYKWTKYALSQSTLSRWAWASSTSNGFQSKFFETLNTFKHTIEQSMRSLKLRWVVGFKQKEELP